MRSVLLSAVLLAAVAAVPSFAQEAAQRPEAQLPVKQVALFSSGVGYFEHAGQVEGEAAATLTFDATQINDILKSLVLQDLDGGRVSTVTYPSQDPAGRKLRSFRIDITENPSLAGLLQQLRGEQITLSSPGSDLAGTILGVEQKPEAAGDEVVQRPYLNLLTDDSIRSIGIDRVVSFRLADEQLQQELNRALAVLAQARDSTKKPVELNFAGEGVRRVRVGYVVETPVWKTSYRLVLSGEEAAVQGWAIVENQTDADWEGINLSLVSGRPISFRQDLYQPMYLPRPLVQPKQYASLRPQDYAGGMAGNPFEGAKRDTIQTRRSQEEAEAAPEARMRAPFAGAPLDGRDTYLLPTQSVASAASATDLGELFEYTIGGVTLPRQSSAMIPIVTDPVKVERVSIYNAGVLARHPLNGAIVENTTGKHLLAGPVTVFADGGYAGDARLDDTPPGQKRLVSYGIDLNLLAETQPTQAASNYVGGKIMGGTLILERRHAIEQAYSFANQGDEARTVVLEHPRLAGWELMGAAEPYEKTDDLYRFKLEVPAGEAKQLSVRQERLDSENMAILRQDVGTLVTLVGNGQLPQDVRDALEDVIKKQRAMIVTQRRLAETQKQKATISEEQERIRRNMQSVERSSDYYNRLLSKLDEQETQLEQLDEKIRALTGQLEQQRAELEAQVNNLSVG